MGVHLALLACQHSPQVGQRRLGKEADMRVRPYHSARSTAEPVYHEDDDCPTGRDLAWYDKVDGDEGCRPCPQCVRAGAARTEQQAVPTA